MPTAPTPMKTSITASPNCCSTPPRTWPAWRAHVRCGRSGKSLLRLSVRAPDLRGAEEFALAKAAYSLRADPSALTVANLSQIPA